MYHIYLRFNDIAHEVHRQGLILSSSSEARVEQETRGFDEITFQTFRLRSKEDAPDYRYMPDPNLGVLRLSEVCYPSDNPPSCTKDLLEIFRGILVLR